MGLFQKRVKGLCLALAGMAVLVCLADYTPIEWIQSDKAQTQWINTLYTPASTDRIEMKIRFLTTESTQCLYCSRESTSTKTFTAFTLNGISFRFDHNTTGTSVGTVEKDVDYVVVANGDTLAATVTAGETSVVTTTMPAGTFTGGSPLTLLASHTAGTGLNAATTMGNAASARLYYVKIYDKNNNLVRDFVPVKNDAVTTGPCGAGLFDKVTSSFVGNNGKGMFTLGAETGDAALSTTTGAGVYIKEVADGAEETLTAAEVAAAAGKTFVKTGRGTLKVGDEMADFTGDIYICDGYYVATTRGALGTSAGRTYAEGGTLVNKVGSDTNGNSPAFPSEEIHLRGTGCDNNGALQNKAHCPDFARALVALDGDTLIVTDGHRFDLRYPKFDMGGYTLSVKANNGGFYFVAMTFYRMGDVDLKTGYLEFQSGLNDVLRTATVTARAGSTLGMWNSSSWLLCKFVLEEGVKLQCDDGTFHYDGIINRSVIHPESMFEMQGMIKNNIGKNKQWQIRCPMTGVGGITGGKGGYLQLFSSANDFTGGLGISGVVENDEPVGGLVVYDNGAIPYGEDYPALALTNACLQLRDKALYDLPDLVVDGRVVVSNMASVTNCNVRSLKKTGVGELTIVGPFNVNGASEFDAGTVRLAKQNPVGLTWRYRNKNAGIPDLVDKGIDLTGVAAAYETWPNGVEMGYVYKGFIRVPGEEGTPVTCNFITSMARACKVTIGGVVCANFNDTKNTMDNITVGYARLAMYSPVTLTAGWQPITVELSNWWNSTRGPQPNTELNWVANFGIGVDWECRSVTNTANYAKLLDPGDGSFLRPTLDVAASRATFAGAVAFGPGVVFDVGDVAPYVPVEIPSLTGLPTIRNGALAVTSSTWTIRKSDILDADDKPLNAALTLEGDAVVTFPGTVTIDVPVADAAALKQIHRTTECTLIADASKFSGVTFVLSEAAKDCGFSLRKQDGKLMFAKTNGMAIFVR